MTENPLNPNASSAELAPPTTQPTTQELAASDSSVKPEPSLAQPAIESADMLPSKPDANATELATPPASAGALLREARQAAGVHIAALAVALKVPTRRLEALESDRWDSLPDTVFVRALAGSVCRHLKLDPQPILALLPVTASPLNDQSEVGLNEPFNSPRDGKPPSWFSQISRSALLFALVVLLAAVTIALLPEAKEAGKERIVSVEVSPVNVGTTVVLPPEIPVSSPAPVVVTPAPVPIVVASAPVAAAKPAPVQAAPNPVPAPAPAPAPAAGQHW
jgi:cytoskeleton protein RodZ